MKPVKKIGALDHAMRFLALRPHSEYELRKKLALKEHDAGEIDRAIARLIELKYLNDEELCLRHAESRLARTNLGPHKLKAELERKGFAPELVEKTLFALYPDGANEYDTAMKAAVRKMRSLKPGQDQESARAKLYAHLVRKGFSVETARKIALGGLDLLKERG